MALVFKHILILNSICNFFYDKFNLQIREFRLQTGLGVGKTF